MRFEGRIVSLPPGGALDYDEEDWRDALVLVARGEIELGGERFGRGSMLSLAGLALRALHNPGAEPAELVAVRRLPAARAGPAGT
jgi:hypothetical protein